MSMPIEEAPLTEVKYAGESNEYLILGNKKYARNELMSAFGGNLNPGLTPYPVNNFANPAPLGLSAFAFTTFVLSLVNSQAMGITIPNIVIGSACFYGGAIQFLAGTWELVLGNTFGATALTSYGAFWMSYASLFIESFGIAAAYEDETMFNNAVGLFLIGWAMFTFMLFLATMKSTLAFSSLFFFLTITFILLAGGEFSGKVGVSRAAGVFGIITAFVAWYNAFAGTSNSHNSYITCRPIPLTRTRS